MNTKTPARERRRSPYGRIHVFPGDRVKVRGVACEVLRLEPVDDPKNYTHALVRELFTKRTASYALNEVALVEEHREPA